MFGLMCVGELEGQAWAALQESYSLNYIGGVKGFGHLGRARDREVVVKGATRRN